jgi:hypothetical protein
MCWIEDRGQKLWVAKTSASRITINPSVTRVLYLELSRLARHRWCICFLLLAELLCRDYQSLACCILKIQSRVMIELAISDSRGEILGLHRRSSMLQRSTWEVFKAMPATCASLDNFVDLNRAWLHRVGARGSDVGSSMVRLQWTFFGRLTFWEWSGILDVAPRPLCSEKRCRDSLRGVRF